MKQKLQYKACWSLSLFVALVSLNLKTQVTAQPLYHTKIFLSSETNSSPLTSTASAREIFRNAYENRYTWSSQFPGYTATVEIKQGQERYKGLLRVNPDLSVEVTGIENKNARQSVENQLGMIAVHRRTVPFKVAHNNSSFRLGSTDSNGAVEIFQQEGKMETRYKVLNQQIKQVNRTLGPHLVTVDTLDTEITPEGYLATRYRATFRDPQTKKVLGEMESQDDYKKIGSYYVLAHQIIHSSEQGEQTSTELNFTNFRLNTR